MEIILSLLIIYGFVLIITRGSIFEEPRGWFNNYVSVFENWFFPNKETVIELLISGSTEIEQKYFDLHQKIIPFQNQPDYQNLFQELINKIQSDLIQKRNKNYKRKIYLFIIKKLNKLFNCQMCLGFWAGVALALLTIYFPITLFTVHIQILTSINLYYLFMFGLMTSSCTWGIDQIVEYFSNNQN